MAAQSRGPALACQDRAPRVDLPAPVPGGSRVSLASNPPPRPIFEADDVSMAPLAGACVAVVGYGNQGRAQALNLRDSGVTVVVGARAGESGAARAAADGFTPVSPAAAAAAGNVVMLLVPDELQGPLHRDVVGPALRPGAALGFAHGFAVAFGQVAPEAGRPCFLAAPKGQGDLLREAYLKGGGLPGLLAVSDGSPAGTWELAAAYANAAGFLRGGGYATTFREECVTDQFGEQAVLCGGLIELVRVAFDTLIARGYGAENAYFECVHEVKLIADLLHRHGVDGLQRLISRTAAYGGATRGPRVIGPESRAAMSQLLDEIESGAFAREYLEACAGGAPDPRVGPANDPDAPLAATGRALRARLSALRLE
ncbi:MAG: ketol-acid reductoisomerase [Candidatus Krumholzibacteriia bacterium]